MDSHKKLLSILHIVYGSMAVIAFLIVNTVLSSILPFLISEAEKSSEEGAMALDIGVSIARSVILVLLLIIPIPSIVGGIAQLNRKNWGLSVMMISGCLSLLSVPLGTALGIYTIWVYLENNKQTPNDEN